MSFHVISQRIKYHYKKYLAITFDSLAIALIIADFIINLISMGQSSGSPSINSLSYIWNFAILMICYVLILKGNMQGSTQAFQGVLSFVFLVLFLLIVNAATSGLLNFSVIFSGNWVSVLLYSFYFLFSILQIVAGIFSYIKLRQYMQGRYSDTRAISLWYAIFMGSLVISYGFEIAIYVISGGASVLLYLLQPISELCCAISCLFTVLRSND